MCMCFIWHVLALLQLLVFTGTTFQHGEANCQMTDEVGCTARACCLVVILFRHLGIYEFGMHTGRIPYTPIQMSF
jgi:hypothetical protein